MKTVEKIKLLNIAGNIIDPSKIVSIGECEFIGVDIYDDKIKSINTNVSEIKASFKLRYINKESEFIEIPFYSIRDHYRLRKGMYLFDDFVPRDDFSAMYSINNSNIQFGDSKFESKFIEEYGNILAAHSKLIELWQKYKDMDPDIIKII